MPAHQQNISDDERFNIQLGLAAAQQPLDTDCPEAGDIAAYFDHRLSGGRKTTVESHLAHCSQCYAAWRDMVELLIPETLPVTPAKVTSAVATWWQAVV